MSKHRTYDLKDIQVLGFPHHIMARPKMYVGDMFGDDPDRIFDGIMSFLMGYSMGLAEGSGRRSLLLPSTGVWNEDFIEWCGGDPKTWPDEIKDKARQAGIEPLKYLSREFKAFEKATALERLAKAAE